MAELAKLTIYSSAAIATSQGRTISRNLWEVMVFGQSGSKLSLPESTSNAPKFDAPNRVTFDDFPDIASSLIAAQLGQSRHHAVTQLRLSASLCDLNRPACTWCTLGHPLSFR